MTLKEAIYTILTTDAGVIALAGDRVTPGGDPVEGQTSVTYHAISMDANKHSMDGPDTLAVRRFQVNSYGLSELQAVSLSDAVRGAMDGFSGIVNTLEISYMALIDEGDLDEYEPGNKPISRHGIRQDYRIVYTRQ
jgi:hypothetical protein